MANKIEGEVVSISSEGSLVTNVTAESVREAPQGEQTVVRCDEYETFGIFESVEGQPESTLLAYIGEGQTVELAIVGMNASELLGIKTGAPVSVSW